MQIGNGVQAHSAFIAASVSTQLMMHNRFTQELGLSNRPPICILPRLGGPGKPEHFPEPIPSNVPKPDQGCQVCCDASRWCVESAALTAYPAHRGPANVKREHVQMLVGVVVFLDPHCSDEKGAER